MSDKGATVISRMSAIVSADNSDFVTKVKACPGVAKEVSADMKGETAKVATEAEAALQKHEANIQRIIKSESAKMGRAADRAEAQRRMFGDNASLEAVGKGAGDIAGRAAGQSTAQGFLGSLKSSIGEESSLGKTLKIAAGTGIVGGLAIAATQFDALATKASDYATKLALGQTTAGEMAQELAKSVPIFGPLASGATTFIGMLTGISQQTALINQEAAGIKAVNDLLQYQIDLRKQSGIKEENALLADQIKLRKILGLSTGGLEEEARKGKAGRVRDKEVDEFKKSDPVKKLDEQIAAAKKTLEAAQNEVAGDFAGGIPLTFYAEFHEDMAKRAAEDLELLLRAKAQAINANTKDANTRFRDSEGRQNIIANAERAKGDADFGKKVFEEAEKQGKAADDVRKQAAAKLKTEHDQKVNASQSLWKELEAQAKRFTEAAKSPLEKHNDQLREMTEAVDTGAMTWDQYATSVANSNSQYAKSQEAPGVKAMDYGGAEMQRLQYDLKIQQATAKPDKDKVAMDTLTQMRASAGYLQTIAQKMSVLQVPQIVEIP